jgi:hypothetical protein
MADRLTEAVKTQLKAMRCDLFEVGVFGQRQDGTERMDLRTWDTDTLLHSLGWLRWNNAHGQNIYVRPAGEHPLSLVDDLSREALTTMRATGYQPAAVIETSPNNYQAWLHHGVVLPRRISLSNSAAILLPLTGATSGDLPASPTASRSTSSRTVASRFAIWLRRAEPLMINPGQ